MSWRGGERVRSDRAAHLAGDVGAEAEESAVSHSSFGRASKCLLGASLALGTAGSTASAAILYSETFDDGTFPAGTATSNASVNGGDLDVNDATATGRGRFTVAQDFTSFAALTFSFKVTAPVTQADPEGAEVPDQALTTNELLIRVGPGTTANTLSSTEDVLEAVIYRDGTRAGYSNTGNETIFLIANNTDASVGFTNPATGLADTLGARQYMAFIRNDDTNVFAQNQGKTNFQDGSTDAGIQWDLTRFGIGNSSTGNQGTVSLDNVLVQDEISFLNPGPEPTGLAVAGLASYP